MKKINTDFSFGELSPKLDGRADLPYYTKGCSELRNMYVMPQGVIGRIGGTEAYVHSGKSDMSSLPYEAVIAPFYFNETTNGIVRLLQFKGTSGVEVSVITKNSTVSSSGTFAWGSDLSDVQWVQIDHEMIFTHPKARPLHFKFVSSTPTLQFLTTTGVTFDSAGNYPSVCTYYGGRLILAGTANNPDKLWASKAFAKTNFTIGNNDDDAFALQITTSDFNKILWARPQEDGIVVGTSTTETLITGGDNGLTPTALLQTKVSTYGSSHADPIQIGLSTIFVQGDDRRLRELAYTDANGALASPDISFLADHLTESGIKRMTYQLSPFEAIFILRNDGKVVMLAYDRTTGVNAWSMLDLGCEVMDICSLNNTVHFLTRRPTQAGMYVLLLEKLKPYEDNERYVFMDSSFYTTLGNNVYDRTWYWNNTDKTYETTSATSPRPTILVNDGDRIAVTASASARDDFIGYYTVEKISNYVVKLKKEDGSYVTSALTSWGGCGIYPVTDTFTVDFGGVWLPNAELDVWADGEYLGKLTSSGLAKITLSFETYKITVGFRFRSHMRTMRIMQDAIGNPVSRISKVYLRFWKSLGCKIGESFDDSEEITFREGELDLSVPDLFTGDKEHTMLTGYTNTGYYYVWTDDIHPLNICAMAVDFRHGGQRN